MNNLTKSSKPYYQQFDGARGLLTPSIFLLHLHFFYIKGPATLANFTLHSFFIASGYLITSILLKDKARSSSFKHFFIQYYIKRILRIFPVYFGYIFLVILLTVLYKLIFGTDFLFTISELKHYIITLFTFTYNFKDLAIILFGAPNVSSNFLPHLWSISLEEQFYIIVPFLIYFLSRTQLKILSIIVIILFIFIRIFGFYYLHSKTDNYFLLGFAMVRSSVFQFDAFFFGVFVALLPPINIKYVKRLFLLFVLIIIINDAFNLVYIQNKFGIHWFEMIGRYDINVRGFSVYTSDFLLNICCSCFLMLVISPEVYISILNKKLFVKWGRVTYGGYVYQYLFILPIIYFLYPFLNNHINQFFSELICAILAIFSIMSFSLLSYDKFELYFLNQKDKLYRKFLKS
ncbi:MAG: acyltransferase [Chitinophagales bacterium]|nr:acyltransferase [Chitinophagales bacterium]